MTIMIFAFMLALVAVIDAVLISCLLYFDSRKWIIRVGIFLISLLVLAGIAVSIFFHTLHVGFSGDPAKTPLYYGLFFTALSVLPIFFCTLLLSRKTSRAGHCIECDYDLRGSTESLFCPECGSKIRSD